MFDQNAIALAGTVARRIQGVSRTEARVARPRRRLVRPAAAAPPSVPQLSGELAQTC